MRMCVIETIGIDADEIRNDIRKAGYSIRSLAPEIGVNRKTIMRWLKLGEMPLDLFRKIEKKTKHSGYLTVWMRLGVMVPVTEDELFDMMEQAHMYSLQVKGPFAKADSMEDYDLAESEAEMFLKRAMAEGESYIPECCFDGYKEWYLKERERRGLH